MQDSREHLESLHTSAIDARNGYQEALEDADQRGLTRLFKDMIAMHERNADELAGELKQRGARFDDDGSLMSAVHRTIMSLRGLFGALDKSVLPGLIDGEERNVAKYDHALEKMPGDSAAALLTSQRQRIAGAIASMRAMEPK